MSTEPFITVLVLCYNYGHLLGRALEAVAAQSFRDFELVFIDNGSTDDSFENFQSFCLKHPNLTARSIRIFPNQGPTHGWNEGLRSARGEYVLFNDADDWMDPDCLELLAFRARETGADRVTGQYREVSIDGSIIRERVIASDAAHRLSSTMLQGVIFRRRIFMKYNLAFPENGNSVAYDFEITFRFAIHEENEGQSLRKTVYNYLINPDSIIQGYSQAGQEEREYRDCMIPLVNMTAELLKICDDEDLKNRMVYLVIRNYYPRTLALFQKADRKTADRLLKEMQTLMNSVLPEYRRNPFLKPFGTGYGQPGSIAVWGLSRLERMGMLCFTACLAGKALESSVFFRAQLK